MGSSAADWTRIVRLIRDEAPPNPVASRHFGELYLLGVAAAPRMLASFRHIDDVEKENLASEVLTGKARAIVGAENPSGYFRVALRHRATDLVRASHKLERNDPLRPEVSADPAPQARQEETIDGWRALNACSDRDRQILIGIGLGETPENVARAFALSRDAVYQILHRFRGRQGQ